MPDDDPTRKMHGHDSCSRGFFPWERGRNSKFIRYYVWQKGAHSTLPARAGSDDTSLFPAALPYPEAFSAEGKAVVGHERITLFAKAFLNFWVCWSNFVVLGCPDCRNATEARVGYKQLEDVRSCADGLLGEVKEFVKDLFCVEVMQMEGGRQTLEEALQMLQMSHACYGAPVTSAKAVLEKVSAAIPVQAERVAIPEKAGLVDPLAWLPPHRKAVLSDLSRLRRPEHLWREIVPACHRVPVSEEARLMAKLLANGMVSIFPESDLPKDSQGRLLTGGFFCVKKNSSEDRLIFDRRPENATMDRLDWAKLPAGACFCRVLLEPDEFLRGSGDDLRNFYYSLRLPENWKKYNAVGRRLPSFLVKQYGGDPNVPHRAVMRVLGMGDTNACDIAQGMHEFVLEQFGLLGSEYKLVYGQHVPQGNLLEGVYLDDLLVVHKVKEVATIPLHSPFVAPVPQDTDPDVVHVAAAEAAYAAAGLERATHKSFRFQTSFKAWGAELEGVKGTVGAPLAMKQQVWWLWNRVVCLGEATKCILQKLLGYTCFIFQYRREYFSLMHHIFKFVDGMADDSVMRIPSHILDEIRSIQVHFPFAKWNMRRWLDQSILATDATPTSAGATRALASARLAQELWKRSEIRGEAVRLDRSDGGVELAGLEEPKEPSRFGSAIAECLPWTVTASYTFRQTSHINLQECRALKKEIIRASADPSKKGSVQICLNDSRVVVGAFAKGRSFSFKLNGTLRGLLPYLTVSNIALALLWVETESNPADYSSRFKPLPRRHTPPKWMWKYDLQWCFPPGLEVFPGARCLAEACLKGGIPMHRAVDDLWGLDVFDSWIDELILSGRVGFVWLAPPCSGRELGDALWKRALALAQLAISVGIPFFLERPAKSKAWLMDETQAFLSRTGHRLHQVQWCAYADHERNGCPVPRPSKIYSSAQWLPFILHQCPGSHIHGPLPRGSWSKIAASYPLGFCQLFVQALRRWHGAPSKYRAVSALSTKLA